MGIAVDTLLLFSVRYRVTIENAYLAVELIAFWFYNYIDRQKTSVIL
jgi:hypothetical protein